MAAPEYIPQFPYTGNQVIISSDRVLLHSKADSIFIFGKKGVGISSPRTFQVDAPKGTIINSNKIELGLRASTDGQPVLLGKTVLDQLSRILSSLEVLGNQVLLIANSVTDVDTVTQVAVALEDVGNTAKDVKNQLYAKGLSTTTYTL